MFYAYIVLVMDSNKSTKERCRWQERSIEDMLIMIMKKRMI